MSDPNEQSNDDSKNRPSKAKGDSQNRSDEPKPPAKPPTPASSWDDFEDDTSQLAFFGPNAKRPPKGVPPVREPFPEDKQPTENISRFQAEQSQRSGQRTFRSRGDRPDQNRQRDPQRPYDNRGSNPDRNRGPQQDNRGPRTDNRGPRPDDRGPRPDNRGPRPDNRGPRPDNRGPNQDARGPRPDNRGPRPDNQGPRPDNRGPRPDNRGPHPDNRGPRPDNRAPRVDDGRGPRPDNRGPRVDDGRGPRPDNRGPRPDNRGPRPDNRGPRPDNRGPRSDDRGPRPDSRGPRPDNRGPRPDNRGPRPDERRYDDAGVEDGGQQLFDPNQRPRYDRNRPNPDAKQVARLERPQRTGQTKRIPGTTLLKALVSYQFASRGISLLAVHAKRVTVNDEVILQPNHYIKLDKDVIAVDGHVLQRKTVKPITLVFHKPHGLVGSKEEYRRTLYSFLSNKRSWFVPTGALPKSAAGIVVVSNDDAHKNYLTSPFASFTKDICVKVHRQVKKTELTKVKKLLVERWGEGAGDVVDVTLHQKNARNCWIMIRMHQGSIRDIAKVLKSQGIEILNIERRRIGPFSTDNLSPGAFTRLTDEEVLALDELAKTKPKDDNVSLQSIWKSLADRIFKTVE